MSINRTGSGVRDSNSQSSIDSLAQRIADKGSPGFSVDCAWGDLHISHQYSRLAYRITPRDLVGTMTTMAALADQLNQSCGAGEDLIGPGLVWRPNLTGFGMHASGCLELSADPQADARRLMDTANSAAREAIHWHRERGGPDQIGGWDRRRDEAMAWVRHQIRIVSARQLPALPKGGIRDAQALVVCLAPSLDAIEKGLLLRALAGGEFDDGTRRRLIAMLEIDTECGWQILRHGAPVDIKKAWRQIPVQVEQLLAGVTATTATSDRVVDDARAWTPDAPDDELEAPPPEMRGADALRTALARRVHGQDEAIDALSVALYRHRERCHRGAVLVRGSTGCGKSLMISEGAALLGLPVVHASAASLVPEGVYGPSISSIFLDVFERSGRNLDRAQRGIVLLDEIDKLTMDSSTKYGSIVLAQLLRVIDGCNYQLVSDKRDFTLHTIDTSSMLFVLAGAWMGSESAPDSRVGFAIDGSAGIHKACPSADQCLGIAPELLGRISSTIHLRPLSTHVLREILTDPATTPLALISEHLEERGSVLSVDGRVIDRWVSKAFADGLGARGLQQQADEALRPIWRRCGQEQGKRYVIGADGLRVDEAPAPAG
jgi:ATP-dependent Clp protease ATP-binding subunit ClpX